MGHYCILRYLVDADWFIQWKRCVSYDPGLSVDGIDITSTQPDPVYNGNIFKGNKYQSCYLNQYI